MAKALIEGASENNNEVKEDYITSMNIKSCIGCDYSMALDFYGILTKYLGWTDLGTVL